MFTPSRLSIGDLVQITSDFSNEEGTFGAGHEFRIIDIHFRGDEISYDLRDHENHLLGEVPAAGVTRAVVNP